MENGVEREPRVRTFVMGANRWRDSDWWPLRETKSTPLYLAAPQQGSRMGNLAWKKPQVSGAQNSSFVSDPSNPVTDPFPAYSGGHDYAFLAQRKDVLAFETAPLEIDFEIVGSIEAVMFLSCDAPDTDLWVKLLDVEPGGKAINLMSPGLDVLRASYREPAYRKLLEPGKVYELRLKNLMTGNVFKKGHRIRVQISASFFPHFSRNLHTGKLETSESAEMRTATIRIHHDKKNPSRIVLPVIPR